MFWAQPGQPLSELPKNRSGTQADSFGTKYLSQTQNWIKRVGVTLPNKHKNHLLTLKASTKSTRLRKPSVIKSPIKSHSHDRAKVK